MPLVVKPLSDPSVRSAAPGAYGEVRKPTRHLAAITKPESFAALLHKIDDYSVRSVVTGSALKLMALLYRRPGELRRAEWAEFDIHGAEWIIPRERMKMRRPHSVPLPRQAVAILKMLNEVTGPSGFVFPAIGRRGSAMSENTLNQALRKMGFTKDVHSSHGFRATASALLNASGKFCRDIIELSLSNKDPDEVRGAYARGELVAERVRMAQWWADYLDRLRLPPSSCGVPTAR